MIVGDCGGLSSPPIGGGGQVPLRKWMAPPQQALLLNCASATGIIRKANSSVIMFENGIARSVTHLLIAPGSVRARLHMNFGWLPIDPIGLIELVCTLLRLLIMDGQWNLYVTNALSGLSGNHFSP